jgi:colanic acid/amylovoran biosynthesis protein
MKTISSVDYRHKPLRILIINLHSSHNAGDAALAITAIRLLEEAFPGCEITLSANDPSSFQLGYKTVGSIPGFSKHLSRSGNLRWHIPTFITLPLLSLIISLQFKLFGIASLFLLPEEHKKMMRAYFDADLVISAAGNFLYSSGRFGLAFILSILAMWIAILAKKPLYLLPQSIGPIRRPWEKFLIRRTLSKARIIMLREWQSLLPLQDIGFEHPRLLILPDLAFAFESAPRSKANEWLYVQGIDVDNSHPLLGITVINFKRMQRQFMQQEQYENAISEMIKYFLHQYGGKAILFTHVTGSPYVADDRTPARSIISNLTEFGDTVVLIEESPPPALLKTAYGIMDIFVGTRMHSNIFALSERVPTLAISYFHKTKGLMQMLGLDDWMIDIREITGEMLKEKLQNLWENREIIRDTLETKIPHLKDEALSAALRIADDHNHYEDSRRGQ